MQSYVWNLTIVERTFASMRMLESQVVHKCAHLVDIEKCCKTNIWLQNKTSIQPRTSPPKFGKKMVSFWAEQFRSFRSAPSNACALKICTFYGRAILVFSDFSSSTCARKKCFFSQFRMQNLSLTFAGSCVAG